MIEKQLRYEGNLIVSNQKVEKDIQAINNNQELVEYLRNILYYNRLSVERISIEPLFDIKGYRVIINFEVPI